MEEPLPVMKSSSTVKPIEGFHFSIPRALGQKKDLNLRIEAIEMKIQEISRRATLDDKSIIEALLNISSEPKEIELLGKCLVHISSMLGEYNTLKRRREIITMVESSPNEMASLFGDFSLDVDTFIDQALSKGT